MTPIPVPRTSSAIPKKKVLSNSIDYIILMILFFFQRTRVAEALVRHADVTVVESGMIIIVLEFQGAWAYLGRNPAQDEDDLHANMPATAPTEVQLVNLKNYLLFRFRKTQQRKLPRWERKGAVIFLDVSRQIVRLNIRQLDASKVSTSANIFQQCPWSELPHCPRGWQCVFLHDLSEWRLLQWHRLPQWHAGKH